MGKSKSKPNQLTLRNKGVADLFPDGGSDSVHSDSDSSANLNTSSDSDPHSPITSRARSNSNKKSQKSHSTSNSKIKPKKKNKSDDSVNKSSSEGEESIGDESDGNEDDCYVCFEEHLASDPLLCCDSCPHAIHLSCAGLSELPKDDQWNCNVCASRNKLKETMATQQTTALLKKEKINTTANDIFCSACQKGGRLLFCDTCTKSYHADCVDKRRLPRDDDKWSCPNCQVGQSEKENSKKVKKLNLPPMYLQKVYDANQRDITSHKRYTSDIKANFIRKNMECIQDYCNAAAVKSFLSRCDNMTSKSESYSSSDKQLIKLDPRINKTATSGFWTSGEKLNNTIRTYENNSSINRFKPPSQGAPAPITQKGDKHPALLGEQVALRPHQVAGVDWLISMWSKVDGVILADEMGLGKTLQSLAFISFLKFRLDINGPFLLVVPLSTIGNWGREAKKFTPNLRVKKVCGSIAERQFATKDSDVEFGNFDVMLTTYESLKAESKYFVQDFQWEAVVFDEAHRIKSGLTIIRQTIDRLQANFRLLLTGTPLQNDLVELFSLLAFLFPNVIMQQREFTLLVLKFYIKDNPHVQKIIDAYKQTAAYAISIKRLSKLKLFRSEGEILAASCPATIKQSAQVYVPPSLVTSIRNFLEQIMLRRTKAQVVNLPPKTISHLWLPISPVGSLLYRLILKGLQHRKEQLANRESSITSYRRSLLNSLLRLRLLCSHPATLLNKQVADDLFEFLVDPKDRSIARDTVELLKARVSSEAFVQSSTKLVALDKFLRTLHAHNKLRVSGFSAQDIIYRERIRRSQLEEIERLRGIFVKEEAVKVSKLTTEYAVVEQNIAINILDPEEGAHRLADLTEQKKKLVEMARRHGSQMVHASHTSDKEIIANDTLENLCGGNDCEKLINELDERLGDYQKIQDLKKSEGTFDIEDSRIDIKPHKVLLFSQYVMVLDRLEMYCAYRGWRSLRLDGSTPRMIRELDMRDFNCDDDVFIYLISTRAGGVGINLPGANHVFIYDDDWNPFVDLQAIDRAHRLGQYRKVEVIHLKTEWTVEERVHLIRERKLAMEASIVGTLTDEDDVTQQEESENKFTLEMLEKILSFGKELFVSDYFHGVDLSNSNYWEIASRTKLVMPTSKEIEEFNAKKNTKQNNFDKQESNNDIEMVGNSNARTSILKEEREDDEDSFLRILAQAEANKMNSDINNNQDVVTTGNDSASLLNTHILELKLLGSKTANRSFDDLDILNKQAAKEEKQIENAEHEQESNAKPQTNNQHESDSDSGYDMLKMSRSREKKKVKSFAELYVKPMGRPINVRQIVNEGHCFVCNFAGPDDNGDSTLLCCRRCPFSFHKGCLPKVYHEQKGMWTCPRHHCKDCGRSSAQTGGILITCTGCIAAQCADCFPDGFRRVTPPETLADRLTQGGLDPSKFVHFTCNPCRAYENAERSLLMQNASNLGVEVGNSGEDLLAVKRREQLKLQHAARRDRVANVLRELDPIFDYLTKEFVSKDPYGFARLSISTFLMMVPGVVLEAFAARRAVAQKVYDEFQEILSNSKNEELRSQKKIATRAYADYFITLPAVISTKPSIGHILESYVCDNCHIPFHTSAACPFPAEVLKKSEDVLVCPVCKANDHYRVQCRKLTKFDRSEYISRFEYFLSAFSKCFPSLAELSDLPTLYVPDLNAATTTSEMTKTTTERKRKSSSSKDSKTCPNVFQKKIALDVSHEPDPYSSLSNALKSCPSDCFDEFTIPLLAHRFELFKRMIHFYTSNPFVSSIKSINSKEMNALTKITVVPSKTELNNSVRTESREEYFRISGSSEFPSPNFISLLRVQFSHDLIETYSKQSINAADHPQSSLNLKVRPYTEEPLNFSPQFIIECIVRAAKLTKKTNDEDANDVKPMSATTAQKRSSSQIAMPPPSKRSKLLSSKKNNNNNDDDFSSVENSETDSSGSESFGDESASTSKVSSKTESNSPNTANKTKYAKNIKTVPSTLPPTLQQTQPPPPQFISQTMAPPPPLVSGPIGVLQMKIANLESITANFEKWTTPPMQSVRSIVAPPKPYPNYTPDTPHFTSPFNEVFIRNLRTRWKKVRLHLSQLVSACLPANFMDRASKAGVPSEILNTAIKLTPCSNCLSPAHTHLQCNRFGYKTATRFIQSRLDNNIGVKNENSQATNSSSNPNAYGSDSVSETNHLFELPIVRSPQMLVLHANGFITDVLQRPLPLSPASSAPYFITPFLPSDDDLTFPKSIVARPIVFPVNEEDVSQEDDPKQSDISYSDRVALYQRTKLRNSFVCVFCYVKSHLLIECDSAICQNAVASLLEEHVNSWEICLSKVTPASLPAALKESAFPATPGILELKGGEMASPEQASQEGDILGRWVHELTNFIVTELEAWYVDSLCHARNLRELFHLKRELELQKTSFSFPPGFNPNAYINSNSSNPFLAPFMNSLLANTSQKTPPMGFVPNLLHNIFAPHPPTNISQSMPGGLIGLPLSTTNSIQPLQQQQHQQNINMDSARKIIGGVVPPTVDVGSANNISVPASTATKGGDLNVVTSELLKENSTKSQPPLKTANMPASTVTPQSVHAMKASLPKDTTTDNAEKKSKKKGLLALMKEAEADGGMDAY